MSPRDFAFWLNGFFEITESEGLSERQVAIIKDHLKLVFQKETPDRSAGPFLGNDREVFDKKYIQEALGIDPEERGNLSLGHPIPAKFDLSEDTLPVLGNVAPYFSFSSDVPVSC